MCLSERWRISAVHEAVSDAHVATIKCENVVQFGFLLPSILAYQLFMLKTYEDEHQLTRISVRPSACSVCEVMNLQY